MPLRFSLDYRDPAIALDPLIDGVFGDLQSTVSPTSGAAGERPIPSSCSIPRAAGLAARTFLPDHGGPEELPGRRVPDWERVGGAVTRRSGGNGCSIAVDRRAGRHAHPGCQGGGSPAPSPSSSPIR